MTPQLQYALKKAGIMIAVAALGAAGGQVTGIFAAADIDQAWIPVAGAIIAALIRTLEGYRDGKRAEEAKVIPADVGYDLLVGTEDTKGNKYPLVETVHPWSDSIMPPGDL